MAELTTQNLKLREPLEQDTPVYVRFYADREASRFNGGPLSPLEARRRLTGDMAHWRRRGFGIWIMESLETKAVLGRCGFQWPDGWPRPELTWWVLPEHRRQGHAKEASKAAIGWARETGKVGAETHMRDENGPARALVLALGGEKVSREMFPDGYERDIFEFRN